MTTGATSSFLSSLPNPSSYVIAHLQRRKGCRHWGGRCWSCCKLGPPRHKARPASTGRCWGWGTHWRRGLHLRVNNKFRTPENGFCSKSRLNRSSSNLKLSLIYFLHTPYRPAESILSNSPHFSHPFVNSSIIFCVFPAMLWQSYANELLYVAGVSTIPLHSNESLSHFIKERWDY